MNWLSFIVKISGIATLIYIDRILAKTFRSVICIYHDLPIWEASHNLIPFNDHSAAVVSFFACGFSFFSLVAVKASRHYYGLLAWSCNDFSFKR